MQVDEFIEEVKKHPVLYDRGELYFQDQDKRDEIWAELSERFQIDAKRKWLSLRERYSKEKKKIELSTAEGGTTKRDIWPFFWSLEFLNEHVSSRSGRRNFSRVAQMEDFIKDVRDNECLYNRRSIGFSNTSHKDAIWQELSEKYNIDARLKFQFLRERYCREKRKVETKVYGSDSNATSPWPYYSLMDYLKDHVCTRGPRRRTSRPFKKEKDAKIYMTEETPTIMFYADENVEEDPLFKHDDEFEETVERHFAEVDSANRSSNWIEDNDFITQENDIQTKFSCKKDADDVLMTTLNDLKTKLSHKVDDEEDEDWLFLKSLRVKMRKMTNASKRQFKINMLIQADEATGDM